MGTPSDGLPGDGGGTGTGGGTQPVPPTNNGSWVGLIQYNVNLLMPARVDAICTFKQGFSNGNADWAARLLINGALLQDIWGRATIDSITLMGSSNLPAGTYPILVQWAAATSIKAYRPRLKISWAFK